MCFLEKSEEMGICQKRQIQNVKLYYLNQYLMIQHVTVNSRESIGSSQDLWTNQDLSPVSTTY